MSLAQTIIDGKKAGLAFRSDVNPIARASNVGTRIWCGRMGTIDNTTPKTYQALAAAAQHFDQVEIIFGNSTTSPVTVAGVSARASTTVSNGTGTLVTGPGLVIPAAAGVGRRGIAISAPLDVSSQARTDGGTLPIIIMRGYISTAAQIGACGDGLDVFTNWATHPSGHILVFRQNDGDCITTPGNFTSATNRNQSPIIGYRLLYRGLVVSEVVYGDSTFDDNAAAIPYKGGGWAFNATAALSDINGIAFEHNNLAWAGQTQIQFIDQINDAIAGGLSDFTLAFLCCGTPNSTDSPLTASNVALQQAQFSRGRRALAAKKIPVLPCTWMATNTISKVYGPGDVNRRNKNEDTRALKSRGDIVVDFASAIDGVDDGSGQVQQKPGLTDDGIHNNPAGNLLKQALAERAMRQALGFVPGGLVA